MKVLVYLLGNPTEGSQDAIVVRHTSKVTPKRLQEIDQELRAELDNAGYSADVEEYAEILRDRFRDHHMLVLESNLMDEEY